MEVCSVSNNESESESCILQKAKCRGKVSVVVCTLRREIQGEGSPHAVIVQAVAPTNGVRYHSAPSTLQPECVCYFSCTGLNHVLSN